MLFYLTSKVFRDVFLNNEKDQDILDAQYVLVSTRIMSKGRYSNVINAKNYIFPDPDVCMAMDDDEFRSRYLNQLNKNKPFLSTLIKGSIEEGYNIIFMYTKQEDKGMKYLRYLSEFIYIEFGYPCYEYSKYASGASPLLSYNKNKVLDECNKQLIKAKEAQRVRNLSTDRGRKTVMKEYKDWSKKQLKEELKSRNIYSKDMSKKDMLDTIELFL